MSSRGLHPYRLVAVAGLLLLGFPAYLVWTTVADNRSEAAMTSAAESYLDAWRDAKPDAAEKLVCGSEREKPAVMRRLPYPGSAALASYRVTEAGVHRESDSPTTYSVDAQLVLAGGGTRQARYWMSDEKAGWRVCVEVVRS